MRKLRATLCLVALLFFTSGFKGCFLPSTDTQREYLVDKLTKKVQEQRVTDKNGLVRLKDVTDFDWDRLYVFSPYTPVGEIQTTLGYDWAEAGGTGIEKFDRFNLLVFTHSGNVVGYVKYPRNLGDFRDISSDRKLKGFAADEAVFEVEVDHSAGSRAVLRPLKN